MSRRGARLRYEQVMELVERLIADRRLEPGALLPTNNELAAVAGVSLITVRRALDELERDGRVVRHQGVGTFVARGRIVSEPGRIGDLLATLSEASDGATLSTRLIGVTEGFPGPTIARVLQLEEGDRVWQITRLRSIRDRPVILEQAVIPIRLAPGLDGEGLAAGRSLYAHLEEDFGLRDESEEQYLEVTPPNELERELLRLGPKDQVVRLRGVSIGEGGVPFDGFQQVYPASGFVFTISGQTARRLLRPSEVRDWSVIPVQQQPESTRSRAPAKRARR
jgi:DNA-binding GntR family transcriptional regulator